MSNIKSLILKLLFVLLTTVFLFLFINSFLENKNINRVWHTVGLGLNSYNFNNLDLSDDNLQNKIKDIYFDRHNKKKNAGPNNNGKQMSYENYVNVDKNFKIIFKNILFNNVSIFGYGYISNNKNYNY